MKLPAMQGRSLSQYRRRATRGMRRLCYLQIRNQGSIPGKPKPSTYCKVHAAFVPFFGAAGCGVDYHECVTIFRLAYMRCLPLPVVVCGRAARSRAGGGIRCLHRSSGTCLAVGCAHPEQRGAAGDRSALAERLSLRAGPRAAGRLWAGGLKPGPFQHRSAP